MFCLLRSRRYLTFFTRSWSHMNVRRQIKNSSFPFTIPFSGGESDALSEKRTNSWVKNWNPNLFSSSLNSS